MTDSTPPDAPADEPADEPVTAEVLPSTTTPEPVFTPVPVEPVETGYTSDGVPTFDYAREKIETRYGTAIGSAELAAETPEGRSIDEQYQARQKAAADRLAQIRESMRTEDS